MSEDFGGDVFHTAEWNHAAILKDKTVAVMGTGASGSQVIPEIAKDISAGCSSKGM